MTGGNRGLGKAIVDELLARGAAKVYATSRSEQPASDPRVVPVVLDVTDDAAVRRAAGQAADTSIVIDNAGVLIGSRVLDGPVDGIRADLETNLYRTIYVARAFAPVLAQRPRSALLNVLSALSWASYGSGYDISKAAAWSATNTLRLQLHWQGTVVSGLHVGYMDTEMVAYVDAPKSDPREVARQAVDGIAAGDWEILADDVSRHVKAALSEHPAAIYGDRVPA